MDVIMPQLGETVSEGKVSAWFKSPGDAVAAGENLFEIETDKVSMEVQAISSGVLSEIRVQTGESAPVGAVVAVIGDGGASAESASAEADPVPAAPAPAAAAAAAAPAGGASPQPASQPARKPNGAPFKLAPFAETNTPTGDFGKATGPNGLKITPLARRLIAQHGIDLDGLAQTAKAKGAWRIGKADVEAALKGKSVPPSPLPGPPPQGGRESPAPSGEYAAFNTVRRQTAERLQQSWQTIPHVFQAVEVDFAAVESVRVAKKADFRARHGVALTYLPFIARAVCIAIGDFPRVNARIEGDGLQLNTTVNMGFAVDLSHEGLVVPVLKNADELTAAGIAKAVTRLADRARAKALGPDDFTDGTYTITNNGSFGTLFTAAIINPPQVAILSTDAVRKKPVVVESSAGDAIAVHPVGVLGQSFDHRAFDGAYSAAFLRRLKEVLETHDWATELG
jgi:2-oxoglutarate dehydrogenase E2 component (dihydrolipoamide succinyltransferase)